MVRFKKGKTKKALDLWQQAGGRDFITMSLISHGFSEVNVTTEQWSSVTLTVFKSNKKEHLKWLRVIWAEDRRGVRTEVLQAGKYVSERGRDGHYSIKKQSYSAPTGEEDEDTSQDDREISNAQPQSEIDTEESDQQSTETATKMTTTMNGKGQTGKDKKGPEKDKKRKRNKRKTGTEPVGKDEDKNDEEKQCYSTPTGEEDEDTSQDDSEISNAQPQSEIDTEESDQQSTETATKMTTTMNRKCKAGPKKFKLP
ncbi:hypothetical protein KUCAC02_029941 [Chaenocephalus aceratus]|uniref:Uncharacterized protein n=1 Tax=Chaenocephalus aceratus TaxID=36190 RepID=A0ACB9XHA7_CHAAC|nr:hypothetical protein KUCAC02_029941 [Chaenocephalus aceratus]